MLVRTGVQKVVLASLLAAARLHAQGQGELDLPRLPSPVRIDGVVNDSAWRAIAPLPLTLHFPRFQGAPSERTEIRVAYDDEYFYAAGWFYDSRPEGIRVNSLYRDRWSGDDTFALFIDAFNDNETGLWFATTPAGIRIDQSISGDARTFSDSWNAAWDAATQVTPEGWFAEIRIPLSSLGFQEREGKVVMGLTVTRLHARTNERVTFPAIDPAHEFRQPSVMQDVVLHGVKPGRPVYVTPYLLSGVDRTTTLPAGAAAYASDQAFVREAGADLKYGVSESFRLDLSFNTDFAQVEADDQQVNLTRFPLFFPEKRQFFQERAGVFDFGFQNGGRLFHSRQIGLAPDGTPLRILGGARVVARTGGWDLAALDVQTARRGDLPSENLGAFRFKRRVANAFSYAGGMITSRVDNAGGRNIAAGLDGVVRLFGNDYLTLRSAATFDDADEEDPGFFGRSQLYAQWQRRTSRGLTYTFEVNRAGAAYRPDLGFLPREDFLRSSIYAQHVFMPSGSVFRSHGPGAIGIYYFRNGDGALETYNMSYWWIYEFRSGTSGWFEMVHNFDEVTAPFTLGKGVSVLPGRHRFAEFWFNISPPPGPLLRTSADVRVGGFYDGWHARLRLGPTWNVSRNLEIGGTYELDRIRFPERQTGLDLHVARFRIGAAANAKLSAIALVQFNSVANRLGANLRLRYNFREGSDLWLVYDEGFNTEREAEPGSPRLPLSSGRVFRVKLTHTFIP
ncbi:MAG: carbohydrate binding family 9 domain-containing protein [Gemmatimonadales bacterium]|nr:carbohydrate binding family 9 domain-containing protein [Gemmatimonadales bacterium]